MKTGAEGAVASYPTPDELWAETFGDADEAINTWRERFGAVPFEDKGGFWQARYYQHNAINQALEAIAAGRERILLALATGTGKTAIAFQIAWKLFHARWSWAARVTGAPARQPRILFLADRNILANQAFNDAEWDGEPLAPEPCATCNQQPCICAIDPPEPCPVCGERPCRCEMEPPAPCEVCGEQACVCEKRRMVKVKLGNGKERTLQHMSATSF